MIGSARKKRSREEEKKEGGILGEGKEATKRPKMKKGVQ